MTTNSIKSEFSALGYKAAKFVVAHAGLVTGLAYLGGNIALMTRKYLEGAGAPANTAEVVAGAGRLAGAVLILATDKNPRLKAAAGLAILTSSTALGYSGLGKAGAGPQICAAVVTGVLGMALLFEKDIQKAAAKMKEAAKGFAKNAFSIAAKHPLQAAAQLGGGVARKVFKTAAKYPIVTSAGLSLALSSLPLIAAASENKDKFLLRVALTWAVGNLFGAGTDNNVKRAFGIAPREKKPKQNVALQPST